jgi:DNA-binding response OmpR family regulator
MARGRVLLIDDDAVFCGTVVACLEAAGYAVDVAMDGEAGLDRFRAARPDVVLLDLRLPRMSGVAVLSALRRLGPAVPVVVVTGERDPHLAHSLAMRGAFACLQKPFALTELERLVGAASAAVA